MKNQYHFTVSRTDRICLISFCLVLMAWELLKYAFPENEKEYAFITPPLERKESNDANWNKPYKKSGGYEKPYRSSFKQYQRSYSKNETRTPLSGPIDIMTATVDELYSAGFSKKVAYNITKYIAAGGAITSAEDLMKVYGMDSTQLHDVSSLIIYAIPKPRKNFDFKEKENVSSKEIIDVNTVTASELESLQGIGKVLAERIIKFRESLGGFIHTEQIKDCYGITPEVFEKIKPRLQASGNPRIIYINETDLSNFSHPYLNKKLVKIIQAYRNHHGPFTSAEELKKVYPVDSTCFNKILPYLSFEIVNSE